MSNNLQYADTMSSGLESKLKRLYSRVADQESMPKTVNEYTGPVFGGRRPVGGQMMEQYGGRLMGGRPTVGGKIPMDLYGGNRKPRVRPGRGNGSAKQKCAAQNSAWNLHIQDLRSKIPGLSYKDALAKAKNGATGYVKGTKGVKCE